MIALHHMMAKTNALLLKCRQGSWGELCMYTNELRCRMLSWWLPSLLDIDPSRIKTGRKEEGDQQPQQQQQNSMAHYPGVAPGKFKVFFLEMFSQATEPPLELHLNYIRIHIIFSPLLDEYKSQNGNGNYSQLFFFFSGSFFGSCM